MVDSKESVDINKLYSKECLLSKDDFLKSFNFDENGLSSETAVNLLKSNGLNEVSQSRPKMWYNYFFESLFTPFNSILLGIMAILFYTDVYLASVPSFANIVVIAILVISSTLLDFFEEFRSNKAAEKLKELVATTTTVIRDGVSLQIPINQVVVGDVVLLSAGSMIPADLRVIHENDLYVRQSSLTGESDAIRKVAVSNFANNDFSSVADLDTICFMGTNVISGSAKCVVIKTADDTYFGKVAHTITSDKPKSAFQVGIQSISKLLVRFMFVLTPIVFLLNAWKHSTVTAFTFAVAIGICITPLLLPVILSSSLSKGAIRMSKKKTIVKKLDSIQNFGAMNILCTDKTGTLTQDKIVLEKYLNVHGEEDFSVLKSAFLNSFFQTGLKGNIDEAIISRGNDMGISNSDFSFSLVDEIPFDFSRRRLSVVVSSASESLLITKGAVEEILDICSFYEYASRVERLSDSVKNNIRSISTDMNKDGLRVIAVCKKSVPDSISDFDVSDENNMVLEGFIGFLDPPKESAESSIKSLNEAGIRVIVLTGDNSEVTKCVCDKVGIFSKNIIEGKVIENLNDSGVIRLLKENNIFTKLSPIQKSRIVRLLKDSGNVVGFMGDGINDAPSLSNSDVGISVDSAVDISKESADIILLEKDLHVLLDGVREGRKTFGNLMKYIKMATSFNFGEVVSVIIASVALPFLPETPIQLLVEGLLYDFGQLTLPFDNVDEDYLKKPRRFNIKSLKNFMLFMGPLSSAFDLVVFVFLWFVFKVRDVALFQTVWFSYSIVSNLFGMHIIRTAKVPFLESNAHKTVYFSSILISIIGVLVPFTALGSVIGLVPIPLDFMVIIIGIPIVYCFVALFAKKLYIKRFGEWI